MTAVVEAPRFQIDAPEQRIVLNNVHWETYEQLLENYLDQSVPRFAYDRGVLEIVSPSPRHEVDNRTLALLVEVVAEEFELDVQNVGSMTVLSEAEQRGFEPDSSFYIHHEAIARGRDEFDFQVDLPPDLVIEVDVSHLSLDKLPIYAGFGVPEVWRCRGDRVFILALTGDGYREVVASNVLPLLTSDDLSRFLVQSRTMTLGRLTWLRAVRSWCRARWHDGKGAPSEASSSDST